MDSFIYETHLHTDEGSACGRVPGKDYIAAYKELGYAGIFVTDHFFHGNTRVDRSLPWEEWVEGYCKGYEHAKEEGDKQGLQVFFGIEENFNGDEYLIYGLDKQWLKAHPQMIDWTHKELFDEVHKIGGTMIQAHPFRDRAYMNEILVHKYVSDGMEGYNHGNEAFMDCYASDFIRRNNILMTSGSDVHRLTDVEHHRGGIVVSKRLESSLDYANRVRNVFKGNVLLVQDDEEAFRKGLSELTDDRLGVLTYSDRLVPEDGAPFRLPMFIFDENEQKHPISPEEVRKFTYR